MLFIVVVFLRQLRRSVGNGAHYLKWRHQHSSAHSLQVNSSQIKILAGTFKSCDQYYWNRILPSHHSIKSTEFQDLHWSSSWVSNRKHQLCQSLKNPKVKTALIRFEQYSKAFLAYPVKTVMVWQPSLRSSSPPEDQWRWVHAQATALMQCNQCPL